MFFYFQGMSMSDDDSAFTTEWELNVARQKVRSIYTDFYTDVLTSY